MASAKGSVKSESPKAGRLVSYKLNGKTVQRKRQSVPSINLEPKVDPEAKLPAPRIEVFGRGNGKHTEYFFRVLDRSKAQVGKAHGPFTLINNTRRAARAFRKAEEISKKDLPIYTV